MTEEKGTKRNYIRLFLIVCLLAYLLLLMKVIVFKYPAVMMHEILNTWSVDKLIRL